MLPLWNTVGIIKVTAKIDNGDVCIYYSNGTYCSRIIKIMSVAAPSHNTRRLLSIFVCF